jgi:hypothetical protein
MPAEFTLHTKELLIKYRFPEPSGAIDMGAITALFAMSPFLNVIFPPAIVVIICADAGFVTKQANSIQMKSVINLLFIVLRF